MANPIKSTPPLKAKVFDAFVERIFKNVEDKVNVINDDTLSEMKATTALMTKSLQVY